MFFSIPIFKNIAVIFFINPMTAFCLNYLKIAHYLNASVFLSIIWLRVNQFTLQLYITSFTTLIGCPFSSGITYVCCPSRAIIFSRLFSSCQLFHCVSSYLHRIYGTADIPLIKNYVEKSESEKCKRLHRRLNKNDLTRPRINL